MKIIVCALCFFGLLVAGLFVCAGFWFHRNYDAIMRIPFALGSWTVGALLGVYCLGWLVKNLRNGTDDGVTLAAFVILAAAAIASGQPTESRQHRITPLKPMTEDVEVLYGDPEAVGEPFVMRIRELPGGIIPPHRHPVDENITVLQGTLYFGVGEKYDRAAMKEMKAGSYAFIPKGTTMFGYTPEAAIVQVHGVGPFHIHWRAGDTWRDTLKTLDDPDAGRVFKFKKGDRVVSGKRSGRIRQGYDSGEMVGYEIEGPDGNLFAAEEKDLRRDKKSH